MANMPMMIHRALIFLLSRQMHAKVRPSAAAPGSRLSRMFWRVVTVTIPVFWSVAVETTRGNLMVVHLETRAPMTNRPVMAAICVMRLSWPPPTSVTRVVPRSYPHFRPYQRVRMRMMLMPTK